jgi:hypothetical protein
MRTNPLLSQEPDENPSPRRLQELTQRLSVTWKKRYVSSSNLEFIQTAEELARTRARSQEWLVKLSRAYYLRAEHLSLNPSLTTNEKLQSYLWGAHWAELALTLNPEYKSRVRNQRLAPENLLDSIQPHQHEALYWHAVNLGRWAQHAGLTEVLRYKNRVKKMIDFLAARSPQLFHGGVYRYYGSYFALQPGFNERDLEQSKRYFESGLSKFPNYLANRTLYAQAYAIKMKDLELARRLLEPAAQFKLRIDDEEYPEQHLEQIRAQSLLKQISGAP